MAADGGGALPPGATIGILGGGQLGRMTALAAARLGYRCHVFCDEADAPAAQVAAATVAAYDDAAALAEFARSVDVVTFEFENMPAAALRAVAAHRPVRPSIRALEIAQDRVAEKRFFAAQGIASAPWRPVPDYPALAPALRALGGACVLKTVRMGYDGKGQARIEPGSDLAAAWARVGRVPSILEGFVEFEREISVIAARGLDGSVACYDPVENRHRDGILDVTRAPAAISDALADGAREIALRAVQALDIVGLICVEMFVARDGALLANEMAPRPHNSGHWTIDACATSQFEQLVRAICGLPLGDTARFADAEMTNLIGDEVDSWPRLVAEPGARLHLYGKSETRPGRKMGHVTRLKPIRG